MHTVRYFVIKFLTRTPCRHPQITSQRFFDGWTNQGDVNPKFLGHTGAEQLSDLYQIVRLQASKEKKTLRYFGFLCWYLWTYCMIHTELLTMGRLCTFTFTVI